MRDFFDWFLAQGATHKLFVYGNHDLPFEVDMELAQQMVPESVLFLNDAVVTIAGITFAAVNAVPYLHFDVLVEEPIDILLSHGAPYSVLDDGKGCKRLYDLLLQAKPQLALFGHIHECGVEEALVEGIRCVNVSTYHKLFR